MAIVRGDEERKFGAELLSQLKGSPLRLGGALLTAPLLWAASNMQDWWALGWFALAPVCFAATGAGWLAAGIIGFAGFAAGASAQCLGMGPLPVGPVLGLGVLCGLICGAMEAPLLMRLPLLLRPAVFGVLVAGAFALVPVEQAMPGEVLVNSAFVRELFRWLELPVLAGVLAVIARLSSELYHGKGDGERRLGGWVGLLVLGLTVLFAAIDGLGVKLVPVEKPEGDQHLFVVTDASQPEKTTREGLGALGRNAVAVWPGLKVDNRAGADAVLEGAANLARERHLLIALTISDDKGRRAAVFDRSEAARVRDWPRDATSFEPLGEVKTGAGLLMLAGDFSPVMPLSEQLVLFCHERAPATDAAEMFELRRMRRRALLQGVPQIHAWPGGGALIEPGARMLEKTRERLIHTRMPPTAAVVERLWHPRLQWLRDACMVLTPLTLLAVIITEIVTFSVRLQRRRQIEFEASLPPVAPKPTAPRRRRSAD